VKVRETMDSSTAFGPGGAKRLGMSVLLAVLGLLALSSAHAGAENVHVLSQTIGAGPGGNLLREPRAVAVDGSTGPSSGDIYVADSSNRRIVKFSSTGEFLLMWGNHVNEGSGDPNICTNEGPPQNLCKPADNSCCGSPPNAQTFSYPQDIVVDSSSGPSSGDVYVLDQGSVRKFDGSGHIVTGWGSQPVPGSKEEFGNTCCIYLGLDVDTAGNVNVLAGPELFRYSEDGTSIGKITVPQESGRGIASDGGGNFFQLTYSTESIVKFGPTGTEIGPVTLSNSSNVRYTGLSYDVANSELLVTYSAYPEGGVNDYRFNGSGEVIQPSGPPCEITAAGCGPTEKFGGEDLSAYYGGPTDVVVGRDHTAYATDNYNNNVRAYRLINVPKLSTSAITNLTRTSVQFNGHVDPDGAGEVTTCEFEYGTTKNYGSSAPCVPGNTSSPADVSTALPAETLKADTTYHYRLLAGNANGSRPSADQTFTTPPAVNEVATGVAQEIEQLSARLTGSYTGDGVDTSYSFEYGLTNKYGSTTAPVEVGTGTGPKQASGTIEGLVAYTLYHYRVVGHNKYGDTYGADRTFRTLTPELPRAEETYATSVNPDSATVSAQVNLGFGATVYRFEYGTTESYGARTLVDGPIEPLTSNRTATAELTGLTPGTVYHFRVVLTNFTGTTVSVDQSFATPAAPNIVSASASAVSGASATLNALVGSGLSLTTYHFEYGTSAAYGSRTAESAPFGPDDAIHSVAAPVSGLAAGTTYHFRVVALNEVGTSVSADQTFTTQAPESSKGGGGTETKCKKGFVKKKGRCVRKPKRHTKKHKKAGGSRG
jgi:hypothetical protein